MSMRFIIMMSVDKRVMCTIPASISNTKEREKINVWCCKPLLLVQVLITEDRQICKDKMGGGMWFLIGWAETSIAEDNTVSVSLTVAKPEGYLGNIPDTIIL
ncbi:hypothetical protein AMECASPLE_024354 [Ameca splendens]|uniref:Uncharacterized protein n=1 Tax=Ameca splendens TaxID=208324 RepID=A0ABV0YSG7_9TELE